MNAHCIDGLFTRCASLHHSISVLMVLLPLAVVFVFCVFVCVLLCSVCADIDQRAVSIAEGDPP